MNLDLLAADATGRSIIFIILCVLIILYGIFSIIKPDAVWQLDHYFSVKGGEPTDEYRLGTKIKGVFFIIAGIILLIIIIVWL